jgi:hypothetical protein
MRACEIKLDQLKQTRFRPFNAIASPYGTGKIDPPLSILGLDLDQVSRRHGGHFRFRNSRWSRWCLLLGYARAMARMQCKSMSQPDEKLGLRERRIGARYARRLDIRACHPPAGLEVVNSRKADRGKAVRRRISNIKSQAACMSRRMTAAKWSSGPAPLCFTISLEKNPSIPSSACILTRAWHNGELYDEERYLQCLIRRGSPIFKYLSE